MGWTRTYNRTRTSKMTYNRTRTPGCVKNREFQNPGLVIFEIKEAASKLCIPGGGQTIFEKKFS